MHCCYVQLVVICLRFFVVSFLLFAAMLERKYAQIRQVRARKRQLRHIHTDTSDTHKYARYAQIRPIRPDICRHLQIRDETQDTHRYTRYT